MPTIHASVNVREHGIIIDESKKRVKCNYCAKEVTGYSRLKQHLGGVRGDVVPCEEVPEDVKLEMKNSLLKKKNNTLSREVVQLFHSEIPWKESVSNSSKLKHIHHESIQPTGTKKRKHVVLDSELEGTPKNRLFPPKVVVESVKAANNLKVEGDSSRHVKRCIAGFLYENDIEFGAAKSHSFQKMVDAIVECGSKRLEIPTSDELHDCIQDEMNHTRHYVKEVRQSWRNTACSILLDVSTDEGGRSMINFLVDCPKGPIFLNSADITGSLDNVDAMMSLLDGVIEDVGVENVVQIITYTNSDFMMGVGKQLVEKHRTIFWTVCASHCISLMLEKIAMMGSMEGVLSKAKAITKLIYNDEALLRLLRKHTQGRDLHISSRIKETMPFLILERIVFEIENIQILFRSSAWKTSKWACTTNGRKIADLVEDPSFWNDARIVLKATIPLVRSLLLISGGDKKPQMPYIYETMDQVKETIKEEFKNKKAKYLPFWEIIDGIWNDILHSPLHSAGYFLNPGLFYSSDFFSDAEVTTGLLCCIVRMVNDRKIQDLITLQIEYYREAKGAFGAKIAIDQRTEVPPATWWSFHGGQCPELQRFAIRILCQTCCGASRYDLKRSLSNDEMFVHHNLHLRLKNENNSDIVIKEMSEMGEGVLEVEQELTHEHGDSVWTESDEAIINRGIASSFELKEEPL